MRIPDPTFTGDWREWARALQMGLLADKVEGCGCVGTGTFTLSAGTITVITDNQIISTSIVLISPTSAAAQVPYWISVVDGAFTINHGAGLVGATFSYVFFN